MTNQEIQEQLEVEREIRIHKILNISLFIAVVVLLILLFI